MNWILGGNPLHIHQLPILQPEVGVVTSLAMNEDWIVVGLSDNKIHVFSSRMAVLSRTVVGSGRGLGCLVSQEGVVVVTFTEEEEYQFGIRWVGTATSLVVSGGCNKVVRVWDVETGYGGCGLSL